MDINFELYKVFYYVAQTLSFSEASERLFISQSAVSQSIKSLEGKLGCSLFFRSTKKVSLTTEGELLYSHVEQAFNFITSGERMLTQMNSLKQGEIKIASSDTICKYFLMPYFSLFNKQYPQIKLNITNRTSPQCLELLRNGSVDFAVINIPSDIDSKIYDITIKKSIRDIFITGAKYKDLVAGKVALSTICTYPLLVLEKDTVTREYFDALLEKNHIKTKPDVELGSVELLLEMARIGLGIGFVPSDCMESRNVKGVFEVDLKEQTQPRNLGVVTLKKLPLSNAAKKFIDIL